MRCGWCKYEGAAFYSTKYNMYFCNRSHFASWKFYRENYSSPLWEFFGTLFGKK